MFKTFNPMWRVIGTLTAAFFPFPLTGAFVATFVVAFFAGAAVFFPLVVVFLGGGSEGGASKSDRSRSTSIAIESTEPSSESPSSRAFPFP